MFFCMRRRRRRTNAILLPHAILRRLSLSFQFRLKTIRNIMESFEQEQFAASFALVQFPPVADLQALPKGVVCSHFIVGRRARPFTLFGRGVTGTASRRSRKDRAMSGHTSCFIGCYSRIVFIFILLSSARKNRRSRPGIVDSSPYRFC